MSENEIELKQNLMTEERAIAQHRFGNMAAEVLL
jgi:hypothetical protein